MSTEGGIFETMAGRYQEGVPNLDVFLKGFSGDPIRVDRKGRQPEFIATPTLTLCLTVQPDVLASLSTMPGFRGRGLLARVLYSVPRSLVGFRAVDAPPVPPTLREAWRRNVKAVLRLPDPPNGEERALALSPEAQSVFQSFRHDIEVRERPGAELSEVADWASKLAGSVARMAGILHLFEHAEAGRPWDVPITGATMKAAIALGTYFTAHALIAFGMMGASKKAADARRVWAAIERYEWTSFTQRDLWQKVRRSFSVEQLAATLETLAAMAYIRRVPVDGGPRPGRPASPVFEVSPLGRTQNTQNPHKSAPSEGFEDYGDSGYRGDADPEEEFRP